MKQVKEIRIYAAGIIDAAYTSWDLGMVRARQGRTGSLKWRILKAHLMVTQPKLWKTMNHLDNDGRLRFIVERAPASFGIN